MPKTRDPLGVEVEYEDLKDGYVRLNSLYVRNNLKWISLPCFGKKFTVHKAMVNPLCSALRLLDHPDYLKYVKTCDGTWVPRHIGRDITKPLSMHTWGLAIDLNAKWNKYGQKESNLHPYIVRVFKERGFIWGGDWKVPDNMHFEIKL